MSITYNSSVALLPQLLTILLIVGITVYALVLFSHVRGIELVFYLIPSMLLIILLQIVRRYEKAGGFLYLFFSFGFLLIYRVYIGLSVFTMLIIIGTLFLIDDHFSHQKKLHL